MAIDAGHLASLRSRDERLEYGDTEVILHALSAGLGRDPRLLAELPFVYEGRGLRVLPTLLSRLCRPRFLDGCGWQADAVRHVAEAIALKRPIDDTGPLLVDSDVVGVGDLGAGIGAEVVIEFRVRRERDSQALATLRRTLLAVADGGFGGARARSASTPVLPARRPDLVEAIGTEPGLGLLYRVLGDRDPRYVDSAAAGPAVKVPPLPSLAGLDVATRGLLKVICEYDDTLILALEVRFGEPTVPGEGLLLEMWQDANVVSFRLRSRERAALIIEYGRCVLAT